MWEINDLYYSRWQILDEDEHTKYVYDWDDGCWNIIVRRIEKKESPWYTMKYRRWSFTILVHSKSKSSKDIDYCFITDSIRDRLRYDCKEQKLSIDSMIYIHELKFYNNKHKLYKDKVQEKLRENYRLYIENTVLIWPIVWQYQEIIKILEEKIAYYKHLCDRIPYDWNEEVFEEMHKYEDEKIMNEQALEKLKQEKDLYF